MRIAVVDDDDKDRKMLLEYLKEYFSGRRYDLSVFNDGQEFAESNLSEYDVVFLDIDMPKLNGIEAAKKLRERNEYAVLVFITNIAQYAIEGYGVGALDFVLKPVNYSDFAMKMKKVERCLKKFADKQIVIKTTEGSLVKLNSIDILYIEVVQHYLTYHTSEKIIKSRGTIGEAENNFSMLSFCRCAKSFIVNLAHVTSVNDNKIFIGDAVIYIGRIYKKDFYKNFGEYIGGLGKL